MKIIRCEETSDVVRWDAREPLTGVMNSVKSEPRMFQSNSAGASRPQTDGI
jgi:hypothetical protein